jgi:hypothetical protein
MARDNLRSGIVWLMILAVVYVVVAIGAAILSGFAAMMTSERGAVILLIGLLIVGGFGFFYKPKK